MLAVDKLILLIYLRPFIVLIKIMFTTPIPNEKFNTFYITMLKSLKNFNMQLHINKATSLQLNNLNNTFGGGKRQARVLFVRNFKLGIYTHNFLSVQYQYSTTLVMYKVVLYLCVSIVSTLRPMNAWKLKPKSLQIATIFSLRFH